MVAKAITHERIELADEPVYQDAAWVSAYDVDPFDVPTADKVGLLERVEPPTARGRRRRPCQRRCPARCGRTSSTPTRHGTTTTQQRVRLNPSARDLRRRPRRAASSTRCARSPLRSAVAGSTSRTAATTGTPSWRSCPTCSRRSWRRRASRPAATTWSSTRSNLWLTIHESIGHATELDRALGYEANYAGTSFATVDKLGIAAVRLGAPEHHRRPHRRARPVAASATTTTASQTQSWDIVKDGVLVGYQTDRRMAAMMG